MIIETSLFLSVESLEAKCLATDGVLDDDDDDDDGNNTVVVDVVEGGTTNAAVTFIIIKNKHKFHDADFLLVKADTQSRCWLVR